MSLIFGSEFLKQERLVGSIASGNVFADVLISPAVGLTPIFRIKMRSSEVDVGKVEIGGVVETFSSVVDPASSSVVEETFITDSDQVVGVDRSQIGTHGVCPGGNSVGVAGRGSSLVSTLAAGLICQFPGEDGGIVLVDGPADGVYSVGEMIHVILEGLLGIRVGVEFIVVSQSVPDDILIHSSERNPVVNQDENQSDSTDSGGFESIIETLESIGAIVVSRRVGVDVPVLEILSISSAAIDIVSGRAVQRASINESPGADDFDVQGHGSIEQIVDHGWGFVWDVVVIRSQEIERAPSHSEFGSDSADEAGDWR